MSRIEELFDVELGEKFDIESSDYGRINDCHFGGFGLLFVPSASDLRRLIILTELINGEAKIIKHKKPILDDVEKRYLGNIIKPFKARFITKLYDRDNSYYICIELDDASHIYLPCFSINSEMYKGMKDGRHYTPKELGLKEDK